MKLKIENERIRILQDGNVNEKSINIYKIEFEFSSEWDELTKKLIVSKGAQTQEIEIIDNRVIIPSLENGKYYLGVVGYIIEDDIIVKRKATNIIEKAISISAAGYEANTETEEEYASVLEQKIAELQDILQETEEAVSYFDDDVVSKTQAYNDNATLKTEAFNQNATEKATVFNELMDEYIERVSNELDALNGEVVV